MNKLNVKHQTTLFKIKIRYRDILLTGRMKNILVRLKRLDAFTKHVIKNY